MAIWNREQLKDVAGKCGVPCASIYLPTARLGADAQQNPIRLKNLINLAEEQLVAAGVRSSEARELLAPARDLVDDSAFWRHVADGLAIFCAPDFFRHYRVPLQVEQLVVASERFHLKPLLSLLAGNGRFFMLALSKKGFRLLEGTRDWFREIELPNVPHSLDEALRFDVLEKQRQWHTETAPPAPAKQGERRPIYFGMGGGGEDEKANIERYVHEIAKGVNDLIEEERAPLVLAAADFICGMYRKVNGYPHLLDEEIAGSPDLVSSQDLHARAAQVVHPHFLAAQRAAADQYRRFAGTQRAANEIEKTVPAATFGRVESLFAPDKVQQWGRFDPATSRVELHAAPEPGDQDLLDLAAVQTLMSRGAVYIVPQNEIPGGGRLAAVFRY
ncbi:MAG TPA: hypothetical protein VGM03_09300 [Phycisphaerae bacterium]|jgi:hypothetical protein